METLGNENKGGLNLNSLLPWIALAVLVLALASTVVVGILSINTTKSIALIGQNLSAQEIASLRDQISRLGKESESSEYGRFKIVMRSDIRADTYLLDSKTGRIWREYRDPKTEDFWWKESNAENLDTYRILDK
jgi:hypothetical protein